MARSSSAGKMQHGIMALHGSAASAAVGKSISRNGEQNQLQ